MRVCRIKNELSKCRFILNEVKDLYTQSKYFQILRNTQNDTLIEDSCFDTLSFNFI